MPGQTISLFRFLMLGVVNRRLLVLVAFILLVAILSGAFIGELALINGAAIVNAYQADFLRYALGFALLLVVVSSVAEDYQTRQFERLLTMPLARWQYIAAQCLVIACLSALLVVPVFALLVFGDSPSGALYWAVALWMEFLLIGLLGLLAALSLEKIPLAVLFALAIYGLAKMSALIELMLAESLRLTAGSAASKAMDFVFGAVLYVLPGHDAFARSAVFFENLDWPAMLLEQSLNVAIYGGFLAGVCLVDFYRKEFNL